MNSQLLALIGGTEGYAEVLRDQGDCCGICGDPPELASTDGQRLAIDHDHATGMVRGLLCTRCNVGLGSFRDDVDSLLQAILYLRHYSRAHASAGEMLEDLGISPRDLGLHRRVVGAT